MKEVFESDHRCEKHNKYEKCAKIIVNHEKWLQIRENHHKSDKNVINSQNIHTRHCHQCQ